MAKALLNRRYDWKKTKFQFITLTLQNLLIFVTEYSRPDNEVCI